MSIFELKQVQIDRGDFVLKTDNLTFESGRIVALTGPNGCGKSTLLHTLAFLLAPTNGQLSFEGSCPDHGNTTSLLTARRRIGYLMQDPYLFNMSVYENVAYGLKLRGIGTKEIAEKVDRMLEKLSLSSLAQRNAHELSGGEAQRVALARTFVLDVSIFLLDEPTANVDKRNLGAMEEILTFLNRKQNATIIFSTHFLDQAERLADTVLSIDAGIVTLAV